MSSIGSEAVNKILWFMNCYSVYCSADRLIGLAWFFAIRGISMSWKSNRWDKGFSSNSGVKSIDLDKNRRVFVQMWGKMHRFGQKHIGRLVFSICATEDYPVSPRRYLMRDKKTCKAKSQNVRDIWLQCKRYWMTGSSVLNEHVIGTGWRAHPVPMGETGEEALTEPDTHPMPAAVDNGLISRSLPYSRAILAGRAFVLHRAYIAKEVITGMGVTARQITAHNEGKPYNKGERICWEAVGLIVGGRWIDCWRL